MEVSGHNNRPACLDIKSSGGSSTDSGHLTQFNSEELSMNGLKTCLNEVFDVEDTGSSADEPDPSPGKDCVVEKCECEGLEKSNSASGKCLSKFATFPPVGGPRSSVDAIIGEKEKQKEEISAEVPVGNGSNKPSNQCYSRSLSLPVPSKLVPAIKGGREKQGAAPKNLSVTWAPDVYDPVPSSVLSHVPSNKNQSYRSNSKKHGKSKQKSSSKSSSRSSKGKDKKPVRRSSSGSTRLKPFYEAFGESFSESQVDTVDFGVGTPDPFCGSSFLKQSAGSMHFSVAEAT